MGSPLFPMENLTPWIGHVRQMLRPVIHSPEDATPWTSVEDPLSETL
jgi:hypothetical protein